MSARDVCISPASCACSSDDCRANGCRNVRDRDAKVALSLDFNFTHRYSEPFKERYALKSSGYRMVDGVMTEWSER